MLQLPTQMKINSPEDLKEQYREWVLSALGEEVQIIKEGEDSGST